jgi:prepilin-type N-terminal cleavage/methylation domain-containing protein
MKTLILKIKQNEDSGFTLIELLVAMMLNLLLMAILGTVIIGFINVQSSMRGYITEQNQIQSTLSTFDNQLKQAVVDSADSPGTNVPVSQGTNVIVPEGCVTATSSCTNSMENSITFVIDQTGTLQGIRWEFVPGTSPATSYIEEQYGTVSGTTPPAFTFTPTGSFVQFYNVTSASFCYLNKSGISMIVNPGCPGAIPSGGVSAYTTPDEIATCAVQVTFLIHLASAPNVGRISSQIGVGLRNQTSVDVSGSPSYSTGLAATC